jgi:hypothetical protein
MWKLLTFTMLVTGVTAADAQTSTTNCIGGPGMVSCTTNSDAQQQEQMNQAFRNLGAAIAARRERKRQEQAAEQARVQQEAVQAAISSALVSDNAPAAPAPVDEQPVLLACIVSNGQPGGSVALYEKHNRADITMSGVTHTRSATFTTDAVTWIDSLFRISLSRVDGSFVAQGNIPAIEGRSIGGTCKVATARAF